MDLGEGFAYCVRQVEATGSVPTINPGRQAANLRRAEEVQAKCPGTDRAAYLKCAQGVLEYLPPAAYQQSLPTVIAAFDARGDMRKVEQQQAAAVAKVCRDQGITEKGTVSVGANG